MRFDRSLLLVAFFMGQSSIALAQSVRRLGVVTIESDSEDRATAISHLRDEFSKVPGVQVLSEDQLRPHLREENPLRAQVEQLRKEHQGRIDDLKNQISQAEKLYQASQFEEAVQILDAAWNSLSSVALALDTSLASDILKMRAACFFFNGNEKEALRSFEALVSLDADALLSVQKYPPALQEIFTSAKEGLKNAKKNWSVSSSVHGLRAHLLGFPLVLSEDEKLNLQIPVQSSLLSGQTLVIEKEGYVPLLISLKNLPTSLNWESLKDKEKNLKGIFSPIGALSPPAPLKKWMSELKLDAVFLGSLTKDSVGRFFVRGQIVESEGGQATSIVQKNHRNMRDALQAMISDLARWIGPDGRILEAPRKADEGGVSSILHRPVQVPYRAGDGAMTDVQRLSQRGQSSVEKPFYKTWWFWALVGVGAAGAGVGTYFLLKPSNELKFVVVGPQ